MFRVNCILFDYDGVLFDGRTISRRAFAETVGHVTGREPSCPDLQRSTQDLIGRTTDLLKRSFLLSFLLMST